MTSHVARIRSCQALEAEGLSAKDAAGRLKQHPFYVQKLYAQARNFSPEAPSGDRPACGSRPCAQGRLAHAGRSGFERALVEITQPHAGS